MFGFSTRRRRRHAQNNPSAVEAMESRVLLSADVMVDVDGDSVAVHGTNEQDIITFAEVGENENRRIVINGNREFRFSNGETSIANPVSHPIQQFVVYAGAGDDVIVNNTSVGMIILGGDGNDTLVGGDGNDTIYGGEGRDVIEGGAGNDRLNGDFGSSAAVDGNFGETIGVGDFDGDGDDDLLFRLDTQYTIWRMQDGQAIDTKAVSVDARDQFIAVGDFDGDGDSDLIFERRTNDGDNGLLITYQMQSGNVRDTRANRYVKDKDGNLIRNANGYMLGTFVGIGDFDGDGRDSLLTRRESDSLLIEFTMSSDGVSVDRSGRIRTDADEMVIGVGKFDGDNREDVMTVRLSDNRLIVYSNQLSHRDGSGYLNTADIPLGVGDFVAGNGRHELLMRRDDGRYVEYILDDRGQVINGQVRGAGTAFESFALGSHVIGNFNGDDFSDVVYTELSSRVVTDLFGASGTGNGWTYGDVFAMREAGFAMATIGYEDDINGGPGVDVLYGGLGQDFLRGHHGEDQIVNPGAFDQFGDGAPTGANGGYRGRQSWQFAENNDGILRINGGSGDDVLIVTESEGRLFVPGLGYLNDNYREIELRGLEGNDVIVSALTSIRRDSSAGVSLVGNAGNDVLVGGQADDAFHGGRDNDHLYGGGGSDTVDFSDAREGVRVHLGEQSATGDGEDFVTQVENVIGSDFDDTIFGDSQDNRIDGGRGNDRVDGNSGNDVLLGGAGLDHLNGGGGIDTVDYGNSSQSVYVHLGLNHADGPDIDVDELLNIENVDGSEFDDTIFGSDAANRLDGRGGNDRIDGNAGNDVLIGGSGNDHLNGGEGDDVAYGGDGNDEIINAVDMFEQQLAFRWAPVLYQDVDDDGPNSLGGRSDYISRIDFDGDWDARNNWENAEHFALPASVYYSVVTTTTHWYITYGFYHARDWSDQLLQRSWDQHENDMEGMLAIVKRGTSNGEAFGELQAIVTTYHTDFVSYIVDGGTLQPAWFDSDQEDIGGAMDHGGVLPMMPTTGPDGQSWHRPVVAQESEGHGLLAFDIGGNKGHRPNGGDTTWVRYEPGKHGAEPSSPYNSGNVFSPSATTPYELVDIFVTGGLWDHRFDRLTFGRWGKFYGDNGMNDAANAPWTWDDSDSWIADSDEDGRPAGEIAYDPAAFASAWFRGDTFSGVYESNPYRQDDTAVFLVNGADAHPWDSSLDLGEPLSWLSTTVNDDELHVANWDNFYAHGDGNVLSSESDFITDMQNFLNIMEDTDMIILVGFSYGGDSVLEVANATSRNIDLLVTLDPVGALGFRSELPDSVPSNVTYFLNRWQENSPFPNENILGSSSAERSNHAQRHLSTDIGIIDQSVVTGVSHGGLPFDAGVLQDIRVAITHVMNSPNLGNVIRTNGFNNTTWLSTLSSESDDNSVHCSLLADVAEVIPIVVEEGAEV
ncbi:MAG: LEPR-XLL domain-containing protein [Planctomycetaceae bacterium]|nr:LEPR-XLL domain-containing protein [Planctomycetaceae bacterium]